MTARIALVGNPNCGKTALFNGLTGLHQKVGNWPGVTVEQSLGYYRHAGANFELIDLPGLNSLDTAAAGDDALDERIAHDFLLHGQFDVVLNILDVSTLERGLYLTSQLISIGRPLVVVLNMMDRALGKGMRVSVRRLSALLGCPVVSTVASTAKGLAQVRAALSSQVANTVSEPQAATYAPPPAATHRRAMEQLAVDTNQGAQTIKTTVKLRYRWVDEIVAQAVKTKSAGPHRVSSWLDKVFLNRWLAFPIFLCCMYLVFFLTINLGSAFIDLFDGIAGALVVELPRSLLADLGTPPWLSAFVADGVGGGIQLVASFIPVISILFLCLAFLEDSGYMSRVAFIVDGFMMRLGLPGKSFVPLIVGFGCNVPAVMATRTLARRQDRLLTTIMAPFMSCGARLTLYALFAAVFFADTGLRVVFCLYLIGIALAVLSGIVIRRFMLESSKSPLLMELPDYHLPTLHNLFLQTWHRLRGFVIRAGKAIVAVVIVLNMLSLWGTDGTFGGNQMEKSWLAEIGKTITPVFEPMGVQPGNWPATVGIFTGIFAKEVVIGTLDSLYGGLAGRITEADAAPFSLPDAIQEALATVPDNLKAASMSLADPLGFSSAMTAGTDIVADVPQQRSAFFVMQGLFGSALAAFSYLLFVLLYVPCVATLGAIHKEQGAFWAMFSALWSTLIAYAVAVSCYQIGAWLLGMPHNVLLWFPAMLLLVFIGYGSLLVAGKRQLASERLIPVIQLNTAG